MISGEGSITLNAEDIHTLSVLNISASEMLTLLTLLCNEVAPNVFSVPYQEIARTTNKSQGAVRNNLWNLVNKGVLVRNQRGFRGNYAEFRLSGGIKEVM